MSAADAPRDRPAVEASGYSSPDWSTFKPARDLAWAVAEASRIVNATANLPIAEQYHAIPVDALRLLLGASEDAGRLRKAACAALGRVEEWAPPHVTDAALGFGDESTDAGSALADLRRAAGVVVRRTPDGFLDFIDAARAGAGEAREP